MESYQVLSVADLYLLVADIDDLLTNVDCNQIHISYPARFIDVDAHNEHDSKCGECETLGNTLESFRDKLESEVDEHCRAGKPIKRLSDCSKNTRLKFEEVIDAAEAWSNAHSQIHNEDMLRAIQPPLRYLKLALSQADKVIDDIKTWIDTSACDESETNASCPSCTWVADAAESAKLVSKKAKTTDVPTEEKKPKKEKKTKKKKSETETEPETEMFWDQSYKYREKFCELMTSVDDWEINHPKRKEKVLATLPEDRKRKRPVLNDD